MNLLLTGAFSYSEEQRQALENSGFTVFHLQMEQDALTCDPAVIDAVVCNGLFLHHDIREFSRLKFIQLTSAGLDRIPLDYIRERGIEVQNARGVYNIPMAEWAVFKVLEHYKSAGKFQQSQSRHIWEKQRDIKEIWGKTVAVIGAGNIGLEVAARFKAFGAKVSAVDLHPVEHAAIDRYYPIDKLTEVAADCDILILTLPLTESTRHIIGRSVLQAMKQDAVLVNISRGAVIDEQALIEALESGQIGYAALDVFEQEPLPAENPLWGMKNASVTPHNSFVSDGNSDRLFTLVFNNLSAIISR